MSYGRSVMWAAALAFCGCTNQVAMEDAPEPAMLALESAPLREPVCFTCDLDPSVGACSTIASNALHRCNRACVVCDDFGDGWSDCFFGACGPD